MCHYSYLIAESCPQLHMSPLVSEFLSPCSSSASILTSVHLSFQRQCTTSLSASTYLTPCWFAMRPGGRTPVSAGSMRESPSPRRWEESPKMERHCLSPWLPFVVTSPAWSATIWATVLQPTLQVFTAEQIVCNTVVGSKLHLVYSIMYFTQSCTN